MMRILILGSGKSGTTAFFYALKNKLIGYNSVFEPPSLSRLNYDRSGLIVKSLNASLWRFEKIHFPKFDHKFLLIRHPFDRIVSFLLYAPHNGLGFSNDHNVAAYLKLLRKKVLDPEVSISEIGNLYIDITGHDFIKEFQEQHRELIKFCLDDEFKAFQLVKYENFVNGKLENVEKCLNIQFSEDLCNTKISREHQKVIRSKKYDEWQKWFTNDDVDRFSALFADFMQQFNYSTKLKPDSSQSIEAVDSYLYTARVINQYRSSNDLPLYADGQIRIGSEGNHIDQAIQLINIGDLSSAQVSIEKSILHNSNLAGAHLIKAKILLARKQFAEALSTVEHALELQPAASI